MGVWAVSVDVHGDIRRAREWVEKLAARYSGVREAYLVGSRALGTARHDSDYDLYVVIDDASDFPVKENYFQIIVTPDGFPDPVPLPDAPEGTEVHACFL